METEWTLDDLDLFNGATIEGVVRREDSFEGMPMEGRAELTLRTKDGSVGRLVILEKRQWFQRRHRVSWRVEGLTPSPSLAVKG